MIIVLWDFFNHNHPLVVILTIVTAVSRFIEQVITDIKNTYHQSNPHNSSS